MKKNICKIQEIISDPNIEVVSFDVFDTLLVRPFWFPEDLFQFLDRDACNMMGIDDLVDFSTYRKEAEQQARKNKANQGQEDVRLIDIYNVLKETGIFPPDVIDALMLREMELEKRFCYARNSAVELMNYAIGKGKRIIVISDMYLPSSFIGELLKKNSIPEPEHIYVSCETGLTKRSGHMFEHVIQVLGIKKDALVHIGDNVVSDVRIPQKIGIHAIPFYRTIDLLSGKVPSLNRGKAFKHAYRQIRSPHSNCLSLKYLGLRCMLAVAANQVFDDPFSEHNRNGNYAGDELLFGSFALGMYCMAQALWVYGITRESHYNKVLFFSRDGYLPYLGYSFIQDFCQAVTPAYYVRTSRKAVLPLLFYEEKSLTKGGMYLEFQSHSPKSLTKLVNSVLINGADEKLKDRMGSKWERGFESKTDLLQFLKMLYTSYIDQEKKENAIEGYHNYFAPYMDKDVLTYDVGYNIKNEALLHSFFPKSSITAAYTHSGDDAAIKRSRITGVHIKEFYPEAPFASWLPRELFLTETAPSCVGYTREGKEIMGDAIDSEGLVRRLQAYAISFMKKYVAVFKDELSWLPLEYGDACLPYEAFLHTPGHANSQWIKNLNAENAVGSGLKTFDCFHCWRSLRLDYWIASHHIGKNGRHAIRFVFLLFTDREELKRLIEKRLPAFVKKSKDIG